MTRWIKRNVNLHYLGLAALVALLSIFMESDVGSTGLAQVIDAKSLPEATIEVIDPESGTSGGTPGDQFGVNLAVNDIILFRFSFSPVPDKRTRSIQSYITEYVPPNTEVVGVRIIDEDGATIEPRYPGLARDGCSTGSSCNTFNSLPCASGTCSFQPGSVAQVHADTGIFYVPVTDDRPVDRFPDDVFLSTNNGWLMNPQPNGISPDLDSLLEISAPFFAHNEWDYIQVQAYGTSTDAAGTSGRGNTPFGYGSPVAGPQTHYPFEATASATQILAPNHRRHTIQFNNVVGPWQRIRYPGSQIGFGAATPGSAHPFARTITDAEAAGLGGQDVTPLNPVQAKAVRWALGDARVGKPQFVEVALRVLALPLDDRFLGGPGEHVNCGEVVGSDLSQRLNANDGDSHPWGKYIGSPACVFLRLKLDIDGDRKLAAGTGQPVTFTLDGANLSVSPETGVVVFQQFNSNRLSYVQGSASPPPDSQTPSSCPAPLDTAQDCLRWTLGTVQPGALGEGQGFQITTTFTPGGAGGTSGNMTAAYFSDQLPDGYATRDIVVITPIAVAGADLRTVADPLVSFAQAGETYQLTGNVFNEGNNDLTLARLNPVLPAGWSLVSNQIQIDNTTINCSTNDSGTSPSSPSSPRCDVPNNVRTLNPGQLRALNFSVNVPPGTEDGLYPVDIQVWNDQTGFGGATETYFPKLATVNVGKVRTEKPEVDCTQLGSTATQIVGTSEPGAGIKVFFNLLQRATGTANGSGDWTASGFVGTFGPMYGGLEVRATATHPDKLESELSDRCEAEDARECSDGIDNDGDGLIDFPNDPCCESPFDNSESNCPAPECSDGIDNDGDGLIDEDDPGCIINGVYDPTHFSEGFLPKCMTIRDANGDLIDWRDIPGCHSAFDDDDTEIGFTPKNLEPRLLLLFDTSGSMNFNTCTDNFAGGDGSDDFPGEDITCEQLAELGCDPTADPVPAAFGLCGNGEPDDSRLFQARTGLADVIANFGEVEWGLMRFMQRGVVFQPPTTNASFASGGWQGGGAPPCGQDPDDPDSKGFNQGELLVSFSFDNNDTILKFMDGGHNFEDWGNPVGALPPPGVDMELRGSGTTPIAGSLNSALEFLVDEKVADPRGECRPYRVVLMTDGIETCAGDPVARAEELFDAGFPVVVIGFSIASEADRAQLDAIARAGSGNASDAIFVEEQTQLSAAFAQIVSESLVFETCNGRDDDCNGIIDDPFHPPFQGISPVGLLACDDPTLNPAIHDGCVHPTCHADTGGANVHPDGMECPVHPVCSNNQLGVCQRAGFFQCSPDGLGTFCDAPFIVPPCADETCGQECDASNNFCCNGLDDDCDGKIDEGLNCVCLPFETCNGLDDDCDGEIDNNVPGVGLPCGSEVGECTKGTVQCVDPDADPNTANSELQCVGGTGPQPEQCDEKDHDCDGNPFPPDSLCYDPTDGDTGCVSDGAGGFTCTGICHPGIRKCEGIFDGDGTLVGAELSSCIGQQGPIAERCNGLDDDCDGTVDNPWDPDPAGNRVGDPCTIGVGACESSGFFTCPANQTDEFLVCDAPIIQPGIEVCNGIDDNCDGTIDTPELLGPPIGDPCGPPGCGQGTLTCVNGQIVCEGATGGTEEICDGLDNNCSGIVDDVPGLGAPCYPEDLHGCTEQADGTFECLGTCDTGGVICVPPDMVCDGFKGPALLDTCDGLDNDCDGIIDEDGCPGTTDVCVDGQCVFQCAAGEFPCPFGFLCEDLGNTSCDTPPCNFCVPDPCVDVTCPTGFFCTGGECIDLCEGIVCQTGETCINGNCRDCFTPALACEEECQVCETGPGGVGRCVVDQCCNVECDDGEFCREGDCVTLTCDPPCAANQICDDGECQADPCFGVSCPDGQVCNPNEGGCRPDLCATVTCPTGQVCHPGTGMCVSDPCTQVTCPEGFECQIDFEGGAQCRQPLRDEERIYAAGGGCGCQAGGSGGALWPVLVLFGWFFGTRRRRRPRKMR